MDSAASTQAQWRSPMIRIALTCMTLAVCTGCSANSDRFLDQALEAVSKGVEWPVSM